MRNRAVIDMRVKMQNSGPGVVENGMGWCDVDAISNLANDSFKNGILNKEDECFKNHLQQIHKINFKLRLPENRS